MASLNKVLLVGNVGKDPEVKYLENGVQFAKFPLATSETYQNKSGEKVTQTEWHNIVVWRNQVKVVEAYVKKGTPLFIEGRIRNRSWQDESGNTRYITEIQADNIQLLGRKPDGSSGSDEQNSHTTTNIQENSTPISSVSDEPDGDLPF